MKEQRRHYTLMKQGKQSHLTQERIDELDAVGFCWDTHEATWLERLRELADFRERFGNRGVPANYRENSKLSTWVHHQSRQYKRYRDGKGCHMTKKRIAALGFVCCPRGKNAAHAIDQKERSDADPDLRPRKRRKKPSMRSDYR